MDPGAACCSFSSPISRALTVRLCVPQGGCGAVPEAVGLCQGNGVPAPHRQLFLGRDSEAAGAAPQCPTLIYLQ